MGFNFCNPTLKIQKSIKIPTPKVGIHLEVWGSFSHTLPGTGNVIHDLHTWFAPSQTLALVVSPRLGLQHERSYSKV